MAYNMPRKKLTRFKELKSFENVFEDPIEFKKLKIDSPIILELACGKAYYTTELAKLHPNKFFIGVDKKGDRIWVGAKIAQEENLTNTAFIRDHIERTPEYLDKNSVDEIWITFPDPFPKKSNLNKRLTSPNFLEKYKQILKPGGKIHLKTDSKKLFDYTRKHVTPIEILKDIYSLEDIPTKLQIQTPFEKKHLNKGRKIYYMCFTLLP